MVFLKGLCC